MENPTHSFTVLFGTNKRRGDAGNFPKINSVGAIYPQQGRFSGYLNNRGIIFIKTLFNQEYIKKNNDMSEKIATCLQKLMHTKITALQKPISVLLTIVPEILVHHLFKDYEWLLQIVVAIAVEKS